MAENHLPVGATEEHEMPMRKKRRTESFEKLLSLKSIKLSCGSDQAMIYERQVDGKPNDQLIIANEYPLMEI